MTLKCTNYSKVGHHATYWCSTKNPFHSENKTNPCFTKGTNQELKETQMFVDILKDFNCTKNKQDNKHVVVNRESTTESSTIPVVDTPFSVTVVNTSSTSNCTANTTPNSSKILSSYTNEV